MTLNFINPELFDSSVQLTIGLITALLAAGTLYYTSMMYIIAKAALNSWKDQDKHKTIIELIKEANSVNEFVNDLRNSFSNDLTPDKRDEIIKTFGSVGHLAVKSFNLEEKLKINQHKVVEINRLAVSSIAVLDYDNPLRQYYTYVDQLMSTIKQSRNTFDYLIRDWEERRNERNMAHEDLRKLNEYTDTKFSQHPASEEYATWETALEAFESNFKTAEESYRSVHEQKCKLENILFPSAFAYPDEITQEMTRYYDSVKTYIETYSNPRNKI